MTSVPQATPAVKAAVERLRADMGGHNNLQSRIAQEVLRLRGEGQEELADALAAYGSDHE